MRVSFFLAAFLFFAVAAGNCQDQIPSPTTTGDYFNQCKSQDNPRQDPFTLRNRMACLSFFKGIHVGQIMGSTGNQNPAVCIPTSTPVDELIRAFVKYVQDNPSVMQEPIVTGVNRAFKAAYPCKARQ
jgi:hypothetical protein